jgi:hypothetical protein
MGWEDLKMHCSDPISLNKLQSWWLALLPAEILQLLTPSGSASGVEMFLAQRGDPFND